MSSGTEQLVIDKGSSNGETSISYESGTFNFGVKLTSTGWHNVNTPLTYPVNGWVHVVGVYQRGEQIQLWANGLLAASGTIPAEDLNLGPNGSAIGIYSQSGGNILPFLGTIDDVRIYNRALSSDEVAELYQLEAPVDLTQGLVAYYRFNGNANDSTSLANSGTAYNTSYTTDRFGVANHSCLFNGTNSLVSFPDSVFGPSTSGFTFSAWVTPATLASSGAETIVDKGSYNGECSMNFGSGQYNLQVKLASSGWKSIASSGTYGANTLVHVVGVYQRGQQIQLWINGQLDTSLAIPAENLNVGSNHSSIGIYSQSIGNIQAFQGAIDDVRIYNRALSTAEVESLYSLESAGTISDGLMAFYQFNGNANDSTSNDNNGLAYDVTPTTDRFGASNQAYYFSGTDSNVSFPDSVFGPSTSGFTFSAWVTPATLASSAQIVIDKGSSNGEGSLNYGAGQYTFQVKLASSGWKAITTSGTYSANTLVHVVGVYERGQQIQLFVNGQSDTSLTIPAENLNTGSNSSAIGIFAQPSGNIEPFQGTIDDVRIYNRNLSADEISKLFFIEAPSTITVH